MKKLVALVLVLGLLLSACPGFALNYTQRDHGTAQTKTIYYDPETWEAIPS